MKKINLKSLADLVKKNLSLLFFVAFLILVLFEIFEVNTSLRVVLNVSKEPEPLKNERGVRINFDNYNLVVNRIEQADSFEPASDISKNPFQR